MSLQNQHKQAQQALYDAHLLDDLAAGAGTFGFRKPKLLRDLAFARWLARLELKSGEQVLDVGCNAGARLEALRREYGIEGTGIDLSPKTIALGQKHFPALTLQVGDAELLPYQENSFDTVISFETFEHLPNPGKALAEIGRVVRPGGWVLIYAISRRNAGTWHWLQSKLSGGRLGTGALRDHLPELLVPPECFPAWSQKAGLKIQQRGLLHQFFTLLHDEPWSAFLATLAPKRSRPRLDTIKMAGNLPRAPGKFFMLYRVWLHGMEIVMSLLDLPWQMARVSDGIFVLLKKQEL
ncbi:methyltransferase domain-containing protein [Candidatus Berkelbacteria bacterium]|nr:methyltransferase domain-containing protein [Candidatus Berkelbacteria bacterium]